LLAEIFLLAGNNPHASVPSKEPFLDGLMTKKLQLVHKMCILSHKMFSLVCYKELVPPSQSTSPSSTLKLRLFSPPPSLLLPHGHHCTFSLWW